MMMSSNMPKSIEPSSNLVVGGTMDEGISSSSSSTITNTTRRGSDSSRRSMTNYGAATTPTSILGVDDSEDLSEDNDIDDEMDNPVFSCVGTEPLADFKHNHDAIDGDNVKAFSDLNDPYNLGSINHSKQAKRFSSTQGIMEVLRTPVRMARTPVRLASKGFTEALEISNKVGQGAIDLSGKVAGKSLSEAKKAINLSGMAAAKSISLSNKGMKKVSKSMNSLTTRKSAEDFQGTPAKTDEPESKVNAEFDPRLSATMEKRKLKIRRSFNEKGDDETGVRKCKSTGELTDIGRRSGGGEPVVQNANFRKSSSRSRRSNGVKSADSSPAEGMSVISRRQHRKKSNENAGLATSGHSKRRSMNHALNTTSGHSTNASSRGRKKSSGSRSRDREGRGRSVSVARGREGKGSRGRSHSVTAASRSTGKQPGRRERSHSVSTVARASISGMPANVFKAPSPPSTVPTFPVGPLGEKPEPTSVHAIPSNSETSTRSKNSTTSKGGPSAVSSRLSTSRHGGSGGDLVELNTKQASATILKASTGLQSARQINAGQLMSTGRQGSARQLLTGASKKAPINRQSMDVLISGLSGHSQTPPAPPQPKEEPIIPQPQDGTEPSLKSSLVHNASLSSENSFASEQDDIGESSEKNNRNKQVEGSVPLPMDPPNDPSPSTASAKKTWKCTCGEDNCESFNFCGVCGSKPTPATWNCALCDRKDNAARFKFCVGCGTPR